ncbi:2'-5' RNA ligase family protein [Rhodococcus erythropolis]|uniref:2'-5' RNA ligase family protein n=1 Tax=Rhodococcus erythropolis TaxID=1833 RepID=UPI0037B04FAC
MSDCTAIDILFNPDDATLARAREVNARLRQSIPDGFALDDTHVPHITVLQRYVRTADLDEVLGSVENTVRAADTAELTLHAIAIRHVDWGGRGGTVFQLTPNPPVLDFQARLLTAVTPYAESSGTPSAFVTDEDGAGINQTTLDWVEHYVPNQIDTQYIAHLTLGFAPLDDLEVIEAAPFEPFEVSPTSVAVYHLGNNGTARTQLRAWTL